MTQEGHPNDHILRPEMHFTVDRKGKVVLCGLSTASLELCNASTKVVAKGNVKNRMYTMSNQTQSLKDILMESLEYTLVSLK